MLKNQEEMLKQKFQAEIINDIVANNNKSVLIGIDEVGRGSLSGPLVVGYFGNITNSSSKLPLTCSHIQGDYNVKNDISFINLIRDSKKVSSKNRDIIAKGLLKYFANDDFFQGTISCKAKTIDNFGLGICLRHVILLIFLKAQSHFKNFFLIFLLDGNLILPKEIDYKLIQTLSIQNNIKLEGNLKLYFDLISYHNIIKGDDYFFNIASASILAKTTRDSYMIAIDKKFPSFGWKDNKGYGTKKHIESIKKYIFKNNKTHTEMRKSFLSKYI